MPRFFNATWNGRNVWWNRKRFALGLPVLLIWFAVGVPLVYGPVFYCAQRRWVTLPTLNAIYGPVRGWIPDFAEPYYEAYLHWWTDLGMRHDSAMRLRRDHPEHVR
ncbi:MAG: hypothetical protein M3552_11885 [Planctomycetota bacterium]|nr:hypothetical protein [Planctomycetaceae bacterium]MDQ3331334.1 hypothetical protein [Planctomycetota bacterium]